MADAAPDADPDADSDATPDAGPGADPDAGPGADPDASPRLVYDDACGFCTWAARRLVRRGGVTPVGFTELSPDQRARLPADYERCAHLLTDDAVYSCGAAMTAALAATGGVAGSLVAAVERFPGVPWLRDRSYRWAAAHRDLLGRIVRETPPAERS